MKALSCANGSAQQDHVAKEETVSPTAALGLVFVTASIDTRENREVVTVDIPGAFLHATNDDYAVCGDVYEWDAHRTNGKDRLQTIQELSNR